MFYKFRRLIVLLKVSFDVLIRAGKINNIRTKKETRKFAWYEMYLKISKGANTSDINRKYLGFKFWMMREVLTYAIDTRRVDYCSLLNAMFLVGFINRRVYISMLPKYQKVTSCATEVTAYDQSVGMVCAAGIENPPRIDLSEVPRDYFSSETDTKLVNLQSNICLYINYILK